MQIRSLFVDRSRKRRRKAVFGSADDFVKDLNRESHREPRVFSHLLHAVDKLSGYTFSRKRRVVGEVEDDDHLAIRLGFTLKIELLFLQLSDPVAGRIYIYIYIYIYIDFYYSTN